MSSKLSKTLLAQCPIEDVDRLRFYWDMWLRPEQQPPAGDWTTWLLMGGRGSGKTLAGAHWVSRLAEAGIGPIAIVGETMIEARQVMVLGPSGIMIQTPVEDRRRSRTDAGNWAALEVGLDYPPEAYRVTIFDGATPVRDIEVSAPVATYSEAAQLADFGSPPAAFGFTVIQLGAAFGPGAAATGAFGA